MTNQEIFEMQRRHRQLTERSKTIVVDLRDKGLSITTEAAEIIEWLLERIISLRKELKEETQEGIRQARDSYAQGQQDEFDKNRLG